MTKKKTKGVKNSIPVKPKYEDFIECRDFMPQSAIVFTMLGKEDEIRCYVPQPTFSRSKPILPILRHLFNNLDTYTPQTFCADFDVFLEDSIKESEHKNPNIKKDFDAWLSELKMTSSFIYIGVDGKKVGSMQEFLNTEPAQTTTDFCAWSTFFLCLLRYAGQRIKNSELQEQHTHLRLEDYAECFLKYFEAMEQYLMNYSGEMD